MNPHPQRCKTCTKIKCNLHPDNAPPPEAPLRTIEYVEMAREDISGSDKGCASHSNAQPERDKLFTSHEWAHLIFMLDGCRCEMCKRISVKLVELRSKAGKE
jgi:hypothetical protein